MFARQLTTLRKFLAQVKSAQQFAKAAKQKNAYVIQFTATWCGPCKQLGPVIAKKNVDSGATWNLIKVDVDHQGNADLCAKHQLVGVPTLVFVKDGKQVQKLVGNQSSKALDDALALLK